MEEIQMNSRNQIYAGLFALSLLVITGVLWDFAYNESALQGFFLGFLFALVVAAAGLLIFTETAHRSVPVLKDKTQPEPEPEDETTVVQRVGSRSSNGPVTVYEAGEIQLEPPPAPTAMGPESIFSQKTTNVLCGACGDYFEVDLQPARPLSVDCQACGTQLVLTGDEHEEAATKVFCRYCHGEYAIPKAETLSSYHCTECGKRNQIRAVGATSQDKAGRPSLQTRLEKSRGSS